MLKISRKKWSVIHFHNWSAQIIWLNLCFSKIARQYLRLTLCYWWVWTFMLPGREFRAPLSIWQTVFASHRKVEWLLSMAFHVFVWGKTFDPVEVLAIIAHFLFPFLINLAYSRIIKAEKGLTRGIRNVTDCVLLYTFLNQATLFPVQRQVQRTSQWRSNPRHFCTQLRDWCRWQVLNSAQWAEVIIQKHTCTCVSCV